MKYRENILNLKSNWFKKIGYVPQDVYLIDDSIRKNIAFGLPDNQIDNKKNENPAVTKYIMCQFGFTSCCMFCAIKYM